MTQTDAGTDRIVKTVETVANNGIADVRRVTTSVWGTNNVDFATALSVAETSTDGLLSWTTQLGLSGSGGTRYAGSGNRYVTNTAPDGTVTLSYFQNGQLKSLIRSHP